MVITFSKWNLQSTANEYYSAINKRIISIAKGTKTQIITDATI